MARRDFGSLRRLPSGRWQARYRNRDGLLVPGPVTFASRGDAAAWLARAQGDQARGDFVDPRAGRITLAAFAERFLADRVLAERTRETYRGLLDGHVLPTLGGLDIGQLAPGTVRSWYARLARSHPSTAAKAYRLLRTMMNTAVADELILRNPCRIDGAGRESTPERPIATLAELELLVTAMPARFRAMILLACWCHLRKAELCARLDSERVRRPGRCAGRAGTGVETVTNGRGEAA